MLQMEDPRTLLLVEDDPADADLIAELLRRAMPGLDLVRTERLRSALDEMRQRRIDAVLLDLSLPDGGGLEALKRVRSAAPQAPVIVLTGSADQALGEAAVASGAQDYLLKGEQGAASLARSIRYAVARLRLVEQNRVLEREQALRAAAQEAVLARNEFLSIASHELRTPVTALKLGIERTRVLASQGISLAALTNQLDAALRHVGRITRLIDQLLDLSRVESGCLEYERQEVDLADVARTVAERMEPAAASANSSVRVDAGASVVGHWDRSALEQVVTNLLSNALKYGAGKPISMEVAQVDGTAVLRVADQGIGIAPEDLGKIFGRFQRAESARNYGGFGLGLYIARRIVEGHGGTIEAESQPNAGSIFTVRLPRDAATAAA